MGRLTDKVAIVTGAASGIGKRTAQLMSEEGAHVVVADVNFPGAKEVAAGLKGEALAVEVNVEDETLTRQMVEKTLERFGRLDIIHNNAADVTSEFLGADVFIADADVELWDRAYRRILKSVMLGCKYAIPPMLEVGGGSIINTGSVAGLKSAGIAPAYGTFKAAVTHFSTYVAQEYGKQGIRVNTVVPSTVLTEHVGGRLTEARVAELKADHMLDGLATTQDLAAAVVFLASDDAAFITAQTLVVDGGRLARYRPLPDADPFANRNG